MENSFMSGQLPSEAPQNAVAAREPSVQPQVSTQATPTPAAPQSPPTARSEGLVDPLQQQGMAPPAEPAAWYEKYSDSVKSNKSIRKFDSEEKAMESLINANRMLGKRIESLSPEETKNLFERHVDPEEMYDILSKRGMPVDRAEYILPNYEKKLDPAISKRIKEVGYDYNIAPAKMESLLSMQAEASQYMRQQEQAGWRAEVMNKYGKNLERELAYGEKALQQFGGEDLARELRKTGLCDHPKVVDHFIMLGKMMAQDGVPPASNGFVKQESEEKATQQIQELYRNPAFMKKWREGDQGAVAQMDDLYAKKFKNAQR